MEAWVLVAHYAMIPAKETNVVWLNSWATNLVATAALVIGDANWDWIVWPVAVVGIDLRNLSTSGAYSTETIPRYDGSEVS